MTREEKEIASTDQKKWKQLLQSKRVSHLNAIAFSALNKCVPSHEKIATQVEWNKRVVYSETMFLESFSRLTTENKKRSSYPKLYNYLMDLETKVIGLLFVIEVYDLLASQSINTEQATQICFCFEEQSALSSDNLFQKKSISSALHEEDIDIRALIEFHFTKQPIPLTVLKKIMSYHRSDSRRNRKRALVTTSRRKNEPIEDEPTTSTLFPDNTQPLEENKPEQEDDDYHHVDPLNGLEDDQPSALDEKTKDRAASLLFATPAVNKKDHISEEENKEYQEKETDEYVFLGDRQQNTQKDEGNDLVTRWNRLEAKNSITGDAAKTKKEQPVFDVQFTDQTPNNSNDDNEEDEEEEEDEDEENVNNDAGELELKSDTPPRVQSPRIRRVGLNANAIKPTIKRQRTPSFVIPTQLGHKQTRSPYFSHTKNEELLLAERKDRFLRGLESYIKKGTIAQSTKK